MGNIWLMMKTLPYSVTNELANYSQTGGLCMVLNCFAYVAHDPTGADSADTQILTFPRCAK